MYHTSTHHASTHDQHSHDQHSITIRLAGSRDADRIRRLADRDSASVPSGDLLVALVAGEIRAAISVADGEAIADPFHPSAELVNLLAERVAQLRGPDNRRRLRRLRGAFRGSGTPRGSRAGLSPQPAGTLRALD